MMFETLKNAWKVQDIRKKIIYTIIVLAIFRIGSQIPVPFVDSAKIASYFNDSTSIVGYLNLLSGSALSNGTLFALAISPYITASIVIQLLTVAFPKLKDMQETPDGQQKIQNITRYLTVALAIILAFGYYRMLKSVQTGSNTYVNVFNYGGVAEWFVAVVVVAALTAGACIVMWMGERIDEKGIGNGISMILFVNILSSTPRILNAIVAYIDYAFDDNGSIWYLVWTILAVVLMVAIIWFVIYVTEAERRLPVQYAKRQVGRRVYGGNNTFLPLKLNMNGVMPIIFAQSIVMIPATLSLIFLSWKDGVTTWFSQNSEYPFYAIVYFVLIIAFAYFYSSISFNPMEVASNLQKNGGTILGHRPGRATAEYIKKILGRVVFMGAIFLSIIAIFPLILFMLSQWFPSVSVFNVLSTILGGGFGGTSLLIVIGVALETTRALEAQITMRNYKGFLE